MPTVVMQSLLILLLILANGFFAMTEMAIVSARKARLRQRADEGDHKSLTALQLAESPNQFLSTVQVGITLIGTLAGALGGAALAEPLSELLGKIKWLAPYSYSVALVIVVLTIGYVTLVLGELVPKRLALNNPESIAAGTARLMLVVGRVVSPFVRLLSWSTDTILRMIGIKPSDEPPVSDEEISILLAEGTEAGVFHAVEQEMVEGVLLLDDRRVAALMTPRPEVVWVDLEDPVDAQVEQMMASPFSRFPVGRGSLDDLVGEVAAKDMLAQSLRCEEVSPAAVVREPIYVPETMPALSVLQHLKETGTQLAVVIDEYGTMQGLVTMTDLMEAIIGEIAAPDEPPEPTGVQRADGSWLVDGLLPVDDLKELFDIEDLPAELQGFYQTLGGFVLMELGHVPREAESFRWGAFEFEVVDMDGPRIDKVMVTQLPSPDETESESS